MSQAARIWRVRVAFEPNRFAAEQLITAYEHHAALGVIDRLYALSPDRLSRKYAHQVLLMEELTASGVAVVFLNHAIGTTPEEVLLPTVSASPQRYANNMGLSAL